jgi:tetratricopeptide (TPR) repeat protein
MHRAHRQGVVHRDLKPANILLDEHGTPKVADFGLAKRLGQDASLTGRGVVGTPSYMAPEQALPGGEVGGLADVYALGAILYELLTGRPPFTGETVLDTLAQVVSEEPVPPVRLQPKIPRDLDTICLKCLRKEPGKRYADAEALAEDLRRFQAGEPIRARPVGKLERGWRWSRRNPVVAGLLVTLFLVLAGGLSAVTVLWRHAEAKSVEATQQREKAQDNFEEAEENFRTAFRAIDEYYTKVSEQRLLNESGMQPLRKELLQTAQRYYEKFAAQRKDDPNTRYELAKAYLRLGQITHAIGSEPHAIGLVEKAVTMLEDLVAEDTGEVQYERDLATCLNTLGDFHASARQMVQAETVRKKARQVRARVVGKHPDVPRYRQELGESHLSLGLSYHISGRPVPAEAAYNKGVAILLGLRANPGNQRSLATAYNNLALLYESSGRTPLAEKTHQKALAIRARLGRRHRNNQQYRADLAMSHQNLGALYFDLGRRDEAIRVYRKALAIREELARDNPADTFYQRDVAVMHRNLLGAYLAMGQTDKAEKAYRKAKEVLENLIERHPTLPDLQADLAASHNDMGVLYLRTNQMAKAQATYEKMRDTFLRLTRKYPRALDYRAGLARAHHNLGSVHSRTGQLDKARRNYETTVDLLDALRREAPSVERYRQDLAEAHYELGLLHVQARRSAEAEKSYRTALSLRKTLASANPKVPDYRIHLAASYSGLGNFYHNAGKWVEAENAHRQALALQQPLARAFPNNTFYQQSLAATHHNLGAVYEDSGRPRQAEASYRDALAIKEKLLRAYPTEFRFALDVAATYRNLGNLMGKKNFKTALEWYNRAIRATEPVVRQAPQNAWARESLVSAHEGRAALWKQLGQPAKALADWDRLVKLAQPAARDSWRLRRALALAQAGEYTRATAEADALAKGKSLWPKDLANLARIHGLAAAAVGKDARLSAAEKAAQAQRHAGRAVELLRRAAQRGYKDLAQLPKDPDLALLRERADFKKLLAASAQKGKAAGK